MSDLPDILITGAEGQLGRALVKRLAYEKDLKVLALNRASWDIGSHFKTGIVIRSYNPKVVINCAAYTNVDKAEVEPELAHKTNHIDVRQLALHCAANGAHLLHISTDFVFGGWPRLFPSPWKVTDIPCPLGGIYAQTKLLGEKAVSEVGRQSYGGATIVRAGWLYSELPTCFVSKILQQAIASKPVRVVTDQVGSPTRTSTLADFIVRLIRFKKLYSRSEELSEEVKVFHFSNRGTGSKYDFAREIVQIAYEQDMMPSKVEVEPILTKDLPKGAFRPAYSALDISESKQIMEPLHWRQDLDLHIKELRTHSSV